MTEEKPKRLRFESDTRLSSQGFEDAARALGRTIRTYRKVAPVAARPAEPGETIETRWNGKETVNTADKGDWVVTSLARDRTPLRDASGHFNVYIIGEESFPRLYERARGETEHGQIYRRCGSVEAFYLPSGFNLIAPWGERQAADRGYLIRSGADVYGNHAETFNETYSVVPSKKERA